ncbi:zinc ribbon domain-containing protein [Jatrophihabitans fulvus]
MIVCTVCGTQNDEGESFCGECGSYLEWEGERVGPEPEPTAAPAAEPEPAAAGPGLLQRVKDAVGIGENGKDDAPPTASPPTPDVRPGPAPSGAPGELGSWSPTPSADAHPAAPSAAAGSPSPAPAADPQTPAPAPTAAQAPPAPAEAQPAARHATPAVLPTLQPPQPAPAPAAPPRRAAQPTATPPAHPPAVPAADPSARPPSAQGQSEPPGVAAVRPGAAAPRAPRRREVPPLDRPPAPGEQICGTCGAGNVPTRKFCRRCGTDLADAPIAARPPWWRRLFSRSPKADPVAGTRQKRRRKRRRPRGVLPLGVILALVLAAVFTRSYWLPLYDKVLDRVQGTKTVEPVALSASSSARGHTASELRDGATNQFWAPRGRAVGQSVEARFESPFRLVILRVFNGAAGDLKPYLRQSSPKRITVTLVRKDKGPLTRTFTLDDKPGGQELDIAEDDVTAVRLTVDSVNRPGPGRLVALGELEFLARD